MIVVYKDINIRCKRTVVNGGVGEVTLLIKDKIYNATLLTPNICVMKDELGLLRSFGYKGTPYQRDKGFIELFVVE